MPVGSVGGAKNAQGSNFPPQVGKLGAHSLYKLSILERVHNEFMGSLIASAILVALVAIPILIHQTIKWGSQLIESKKKAIDTEDRGFRDNVKNESGQLELLSIAITDLENKIIQSKKDNNPNLEELKEERLKLIQNFEKNAKALDDTFANKKWSFFSARELITQSETHESEFARAKRERTKASEAFTLAIENPEIEKKKENSATEQDLKNPDIYLEVNQNKKEEYKKLLINLKKFKEEVENEGKLISKNYVFFEQLTKNIQDVKSSFHNLSYDKGVFVAGLSNPQTNKEATANKLVDIKEKFKNLEDELVLLDQEFEELNENLIKLDENQYTQADEKKALLTIQKQKEEWTTTRFAKDLIIKAGGIGDGDEGVLQLEKKLKESGVPKDFLEKDYQYWKTKSKLERLTENLPNIGTDVDIENRKTPYRREGGDLRGLNEAIQLEINAEKKKANEEIQLLQSELKTLEEELNVMKEKNPILKDLIKN